MWHLVGRRGLVVAESVVTRRLVQPWDSVSHLRAAQVQQRRPGRSFCLSGVDFKRSFWCSHSLSEDLVQSCWDLLMFTLVVLVIGNGSLVIRIHSRGEVDRRHISGRWLYWWRSREWRTWSGFSGVAVTLGLSHRRPDPSDRRPGRSLWSPGLGSPGTSLWSSRLLVWSPGCWVMSGSRHWRRYSRAGRGIWNHTLVHPTL